MGKIKFWTKKANKDTNNCYCSHYLKDKSMMADLGVEHNNDIEYEIINGDFSSLIDDLGFYEDLMRKYKITTQEKLETILKWYRDTNEILDRLKGDRDPIIKLTV